MSELSAQVITVAHDPQTGEQQTFPTPADVPKNWVEGAAPSPDDPTLYTAARIGTTALVAYLLWEAVL